MTDDSIKHIQEAESISANTILEKKLGNIVVRLKLSSDRLALYMDCERINPKERCTLDRATLLYLIKPAIGAERLNTSVIDDIIKLVKRGEAVENRRIAQGRASRSAAPAEIEFVVRDPGQEQGVQALPRGDLLCGIVPDMIVALVAPPRGGTPGRDVFGALLKGAAALQFDFVCGHGLAVEDDRCSFIRELLSARLSGRLLRSEDRLQVDETLEIASEMLSDLGGRCFTGSLKVNGPVLGGQKAIAVGNLVVDGDMLQGFAESKLGAVAINGDIKDRSQLNSCAGISLKSGADSTLQALENIEVTGDISRIAVSCYGKVAAAQGTILGCSISSVFGVEAQRIASDGESPTRIICRQGFQLSERLGVIEDLQQQLQTELAQLTGNINKVLKGAISKAGELEAAKEINQLLMVRHALNITSEAALRESNFLNSLIDQDLQFRVNFLAKIERGVTICVGKESFVIESDLTGPGTIEYRPEHQRFVALPYTPLR